MTAHRVLLAISTSRYSQHLVNHALAEAERLRAEGGDVSIDVLYIIEAEAMAQLASRVGDTGLVGAGPQETIIEELGREHHRMALRRVGQARRAAKKAGVPVEVREVEGAFVEEVLRQAESVPYDVILITRADRPFISRFLFGSKADRVARLARNEGLGRVIIDEES